MGGSTHPTGAGAPVDNMPPYIALYPFIANQGSFYNIGTIRWTAYGSTLSIPGLRCEGQLYNISQNTLLFSILGTNYGGNGSTSFGIPDLRGRMMVGAGAGPGLNPVQLGERGGQFQRNISVAELPAHTHVYGGGTTGSTGSGSAVAGRAPYLGLTTGVALTGIYGGSDDYPAIAEVRFHAGTAGFFSYQTNNTYWPCDGSSNAITPADSTFELFGLVVGTTWGGDGVNTVNVPDLRGRSPFGAGTGGPVGTFLLAAKGGSDMSPGMTLATMPAHTHTYVGAPPDTAGPTGGTFTLSPASPVANGTVLTGSFSGWSDPSSPLTYSIHLGTTAIVAPGSNASPTFTLPPGTHSVIGRVTDSVGNSTDTVVSFTVLPPDTQPPTIGGTFSPLSIVAGTPLPDYRGQAVTNDNVGVVSVTQSPAPGTPTSVGSVTVVLTARDAANNAGSVSFNVTVTPANPVSTVLASKGGALFGAGVTGSGIPADAVWQSFGVPSVNEAGQVAVNGTYKAGGKIVSGTFTGGPGTINLQISLSKGAPAPGITNAVVSAMKDPLLGPDGSLAWIVTLANAPGTTGAVTSADNAAIILDPDGAGPNPPVVVARKGAVATGAAPAPVPPGVDAMPEWGTFTSVALGGEVLAFTATMTSKTPGLTGAPGPGGVTSATDAGLWVLERSSGTLRLALRDGDAVQGSTVKTINALVARPGSAGQGRGVEADGVLDYAVFRVTLADNRQIAGYVDYVGTPSFSYVAGATAPDYGTGALWQKFGVPTMARGSTAMAFLGTVKAMTGTATSGNNVAIFAEDDTTYVAAAVVRKGDAAGVSGGVFSALKDPVNAQGRSVAFMGTMKSNSAALISSANDSGIWHRSDSSALTLIAREGTQPPEAPAGAQWKTFTSLALADGNRPLFVASMHSKTGTASPGPGGITTANDVGLWATDSAGSLRLLIREGDAIGTSTVKTMTVLSTVSGSPSQTRSFNNGGHVILRVTDATGAQHLVNIAVP